MSRIVEFARHGGVMFMFHLVRSHWIGFDTASQRQSTLHIERGVSGDDLTRQCSVSVQIALSVSIYALLE